MNFTTEQQQIIDTITGPLLVLAPVGTGKTSVMAARTQRALESGIAPDRILCVTFTNRAAAEMQLRMRKQKVDTIDSLTISTIHALCAFMLRSSRAISDIPRNFLIVDETEAAEIFTEACDRILNLQNPIHVSWRSDFLNFFPELLTLKANVHSDALALSLHPPLLELSSSYTPNNWPQSPQALDILRAVIDEYHRLLRHALLLDFADLIYYTRALLHHDSRFRVQWETRFGWIQVDEVQDITPAEFDILLTLAHRHQNIALFGDPDQTIYQWRGSAPFHVIEQFKTYFPNHKVFHLTWNFRSTKQLLKAADAVAQHFRERYTVLKPAPHLEEGDAPIIHKFPTTIDEAIGIATLVQEIRKELPSFSIAVLTRTNEYADTLSSVMEKLELHPVTATRLRSFRSPIIKYVAAVLRLLLNPYDQLAARSMLQRLGRTADLSTLLPLLTPTINPALLINEATIATPNIYHTFLSALRQKRVFVIDIETSHPRPHAAEMLEIAVLQLDAQLQISKRFHQYITPEDPQHLSGNIHQLTPEFLAQYGTDKETALLRFLDFVGLQPFFVGYNVAFDINILRKELEQRQLSHLSFRFLDLLPIVHTHFALDRYSLSAVAEHLKLPMHPTHTAIADAKTVVALLKHLLPTITHLARRNPLHTVPADLHLFCQTIAAKLSEWREISTTYPLTTLLKLILSTEDPPGYGKILQQHLSRNPDTKQTVELLYATAAEWDEKIQNPFLRLQAFLSQIALSRAIDNYQSLGDCLVTTVHQSKGLEFDVVLVPGLDALNFPSIYTPTDKEGHPKLEEEKRLFYVAVTRAKRLLILTWAERDRFHNETLGPSPFLDFLD